jgi:1,4-alpha-glucan branching enzyme
VSFLRKGSKPEDTLVFVCNFTPVARSSYRVGVPFKGFYREILNSDSEIYGGSNAGNFGGVRSNEAGHDKQPYSIDICVPPLAVVIFKPEIQ